MKTKLTLALALALAGTGTVNAQTNTFPATGNVGVGTLAPATSLQVIGTSRFGAAANYAQFDGSGNFSFNGNANFRVGGNRYAFQYSGNPNYGLFFNSTNVRYEFRDGSAIPVFYVGANDGNAAFTGGVRVGNSLLNNAGNIRWTGADFEGYNGVAWVSFTAAGGGGWGLTGNSGTNAATNFLGTVDAQALVFKTSNTEKMRLLTDGKLGIGTNAPNSKLHISAAVNEDALRIQINGSTRFLVNDAGGVTIGSTTEAPANTLYVNGNIGIGQSVPVARLHIEGGTDASLNSGGYIIAGDVASNNIVIDNNEIMARDGASADGSGNLFLNNDGGDVQLGLSLRTNYATGSVRIGNSIGTAPSKTLHIGHTNGIATNGLLLESNYATGLNWQLYTATTDELWLLNDGAQKGEFNGTSGVYTPVSDKKFKKDIAAIPDVIDRVMKLKPSLYHFNNQKLQNDRKFIGMIAQEVQPIFPEVVYEHDGKNDGTESFLTMDYSAFGVIAIKAIQEQQEKINSQDKKIEELTKLVQQLQVQATAGSAENISTNTKNINPETSLEQNAPNPFTSSTVIRYKVPASVTSAQIMVANATGNTVKAFTLSNKGAGSVTINANELAAGTYYYSLIVEGKKLDSKKMVLVK